jgi:CRISPR/Cas system-associated endonuclease Cas3-HD
MTHTADNIPTVKTVSPKMIRGRFTQSRDLLVSFDEGSSEQAAALSLILLLLPIAQSVDAHRAKSTELLDLDVVRSSSL